MKHLQPWSVHCDGPGCTTIAYPEGPAFVSTIAIMGRPFAHIERVRVKVMGMTVQDWAPGQVQDDGEEIQTMSGGELLAAHGRLYGFDSPADGVVLRLGEKPPAGVLEVMLCDRSKGFQVEVTTSKEAPEGKRLYILAECWDMAPATDAAEPTD